MKISSLSCPLCNLDFGAFWIRDVQPAKKLLKNKQTCILPAVSRFHSYWKAITSGSVPCAWILRMHLPCVPHPQFFSRSLRNVWLGKPLISPASSPYEPKLPVWASGGLLCKLNVTGGSLWNSWALGTQALLSFPGFSCCVFSVHKWQQAGDSPPKPFPVAHQ